MSASTPEITSATKHLLTLSTERPGEACAEFRVGIRSVPYLADHGFQDMVILPGSFYVEMARYVDRELTQRVPGLARNLTFRNPVVLAAEDVVIRVDVSDRGDGHVEYTFYESDMADGRSRTAARQYAARLEIDRNASPSRGAGADAPSIEAFQAQSDAVIDAHRFYGMLRQNGNFYGPSFQRISAIWRTGHRSLGKLSAARGEADPLGLHPSVLDSMTQVLASCSIERGKTFVLRSIERVGLADGDLPDTLWAHAVLRQQGNGDEESLVGDIRVFDQSGNQHVELSGVAFTFLDHVDAADEVTATSLVIASNFTAEPVEDSLQFWGDHFGAPVHLEFAPYDQIFQQLLDPESAFRKNRDGVNVIMLRLEEWAARDRHGGMTLSRERAERYFGDRARYVLPNGLEIVHLNRYETDYLYQEIFEDQCYMRHGIRLRDGATVVDVGANIGLFSLFVMSRCKNPTICAFEPAPALHELLRANCEAYGSSVRAENLGVSDRPKTATLTYYEKSSVFSGFHADETEDREAIQAVVRNTLNRETPVEGESVEDYVTELTADRLRRTTHECRLTSVSEIIRENQIDTIDLLKIDAEKSELDIINGIDDGDWPKIAQIVIEIHDPTRKAVEKVESLLIAKEYRCAVDQERLLEHSGLYNLYATRGEAAAGAGKSHAPRSAGGLRRDVRDFCAALGAFMKQSKAPLVLCVCPGTPAAEADAGLKAALNDAEQALLSEAGAMPKVHTIASASPLQRYPVKDYYDPHGHHLGHIPYTPECYAAIGTTVFRAIFNLKREPYKVIVLDCDNTLWKGACGEEGSLGVEVSEPYRRLQEFMVGQMKAGMLLCLCSKNNEQDVLDVFEQRADMALGREHLVSWRINWNSKSDNIRSLADELNLGLDSFIFIDDNPVECADVKINCPGVLTLQLPRNSESFPTFLEHVWAFDHAGSTEEDSNRTRMYRENAGRQRFRDQTVSLKDFMKGLELRVEIAEATNDDLGRVSQLTFRTNQFNFTTVRRSENEIRDLLKRGDASCLVVRVTDRFGDYGLVGIVLYATKADRYKVDTFLLSCRVLGRGVEHAILSQLGQRAIGEGKRLVELAHRPTEKNAPVREFIKSLGDQEGIETATSWTFTAERLCGLEYNPDQTAQLGDEAPTAPDPDAHAPRPGREFGVADRSESMRLIGERLHGINRIAKAIEEYRLGKVLPQAPGDGAPGGTLQTALLNIWRKVLGRPRIGMNDNFFELGGTSLRAVQVIAMIKKELNRNLSIVTLFECPTVTQLAARLQAAFGAPDGAATAAEAALRGQRRRNVTRRKAA
jgi:FkbH-like protein/FkbM family methyltransferase